MIAIYPEMQLSVVGTSEDANFVADNLLDSKIKKCWKAASGVTSATLTVTIASGAAYLALFGTNATSAICTVKDNGGATVKTETFDLVDGDRTYNRFWLEYEEQSGEHTVEIALTASETVYAGVVRAGAGVQVDNPDEGLKEGKKDFSIVHELSSGATYVRKRDIVRTFAGKIQALRDPDFYNLSDIYDYYGPQPLAWLIAEGFDDRQWCCFGAISEPLPGTHDEAIYCPVDITITEAL